MLKSMSSALRISIAIIATCAAVLVEFLFINAQALDWYAALVKPPLTPPGWLFGIVWLILYAFMAAALIIVWGKEPHLDHMAGWVRFYFIQLLFNATWTMFFFGFHSMIVAFIDILFLAFMVMCLVAGGWEIDRRATYLLAPYLLWIFFAGYLNLAIWLLN